MKGIVYVFVFIPFLGLCAQEIKPGGVNGVAAWEITESFQNGLSGFRPVLNDYPSRQFNVSGKTRSINNNPALFFTDGGNTFNSTLDIGKLQSFSLFTVCQETDTTSEKIIASLENDSIAEMVMTNRRMAALDVYRYASYDTRLSLLPQIYSYVQNKSTDSGSVSRRLRLGRPPRSQHLPASVYSGIVPELILFNRVVSPKERQQVESYLAIKYGITLNQEFPVSYLNSRGQVIWDAERNITFNSNIAGIGRDDLSGLTQGVSESTQTPGVMKIGYLNDLKDNSFLVWGDNARPLSLSEDTGLRRLGREWKISAFNATGDSVSVETDMMSLSEIDPLREDEIFWLMIDRSGTGKYPFRETLFIPCQSISTTGKKIRFSPVVFDTDTSGSDVFTLVAAPSFFTRTILVQPACQSPYSGKIETEIAGGDPPFEMVLTGISDSRIHMSSYKSSRDHIFEGVSQGEYLLRVTDSKGKTFLEKIRVSNSVPWKLQVNGSYSIQEGQHLSLDASAGMPDANLMYAWTMPDGSELSSESVTVSQPGTYLLSVTDAMNCSSTMEISVKQSGGSDFRMVDIFPNPANGLFTLRIMLDRAMNVNLVITDINGKVVRQSILRNERFYRYSDMIELPGTYFITLVSGKEKVTLKLIVL